MMFCDLAHQQGFDPLLPSNWYPITYSSFRNVKVCEREGERGEGERMRGREE